MAKRKKGFRFRRRTGPIPEALFPAYRPVLLAALGLGGLPTGAAAFPATLELSSLDGTNGFRIDGVSADDGSGGAVSAAGDVNGDGIADLLIGAAGADPNGNRSGASYVLFGRVPPGSFPARLGLSSLDGTNGFRIEGATAFDTAGNALSAAGDVNGDGIADLLIGALFADPNGSDSGAGYVVFGRAPPRSFPARLGPSSLDGTNGFRIEGAAASDNSGFAVSGAGDVNGDGIADLLIGALGAAPNGESSGASYVVFGRAPPGGFPASLGLSSLDGTNGFRIEGAAAGDRSGVDVSTAGDVNGDGIADLLIGADFADPNGESSGASYVVFGRAPPRSFPASLGLSSLDGTNGFRIEGVAAGDQAGMVSAAGDVNGDGGADLLIGAYGADPNGSGSGASYVVFGEPPPPVRPELPTPLGPPPAPDAETEPLDLSNPRPFGCEFSEGEITCVEVDGATLPFIVFDVNIPADARFLQFEFSFEGADGQALNTESLDALKTSADDARQRINGGDLGAVFISNVPIAALPGSSALPGGGFRSSGQFRLPASGTTTATVTNFPSGAPGSVFRLRNFRIDRCTRTCFGRRATVCGSNGPERLTGTRRSDVIVGRGGNDTVVGRGGNDRICGGDGKDRLSGGTGNDRLDGGAGRDRLLGQAGQDLLKGGSGRDRCDGGSGSDRASRCERTAEVP